MNEQIRCGICNSFSKSTIRRVRKFYIYKCNNCGCFYTGSQKVWDYSNSKTPINEKLSIYEKFYWPKRKVSASFFLDEARNYLKTGYLLEVGCGFGFFLNEARMRGWSPFGVEIAPDELQWARTNFNLDVFNSLDDIEIQNRKFDLIVLWDVIEHIPDVNNLLENCFNLLNSEGALVIKTPNAEGLTIKPTFWFWLYLQFYWQLIYPANPIEHVYHFTPNFLTSLIKEKNFVVKKIITKQKWQERILVGRNQFIKFIRLPLMWIAWKFNLPYEMVIWAEKPKNF